MGKALGEMTILFKDNNKFGILLGNGRSSPFGKGLKCTSMHLDFLCTTDALFLEAVRRYGEGACLLTNSPVNVGRSAKKDAAAGVVAKMVFLGKGSSIGKGKR